MAACGLPSWVVLGSWPAMGQLQHVDKAVSVLGPKRHCPCTKSCHQVDKSTMADRMGSTFGFSCAEGLIADSFTAVAIVLCCATDTIPDGRLPVLPTLPTLHRGTSHTSSMLQNKPLLQSSRRSHGPPSTHLQDSGQSPKASGNRQQRQHP